MRWSCCRQERGRDQCLSGHCHPLLLLYGAGVCFWRDPAEEQRHICWERQVPSGQRPARGCPPSISHAAGKADFCSGLAFPHTTAWKTFSLALEDVKELLVPYHPLLLPCVERESPPLPQRLGKWEKDSGQAETWDTGLMLPPLWLGPTEPQPDGPFLQGVTALMGTGSHCRLSPVGLSPISLETNVQTHHGHYPSTSAHISAPQRVPMDSALRGLSLQRCKSSTLQGDDVAQLLDLLVHVCPAALHGASSPASRFRVCVTVTAAPVCWRQCHCPSVTSNRTSTMAPPGTAHPAPAFSHLLVACCPNSSSAAPTAPSPLLLQGTERPLSNY